jgi:hypothetical protein
MLGGVKTPELREKYKEEHCVQNWSTKNPSRPAHSTTAQHTTPAPQHSTNTSTTAHSTSTTAQVLSAHELSIRREFTSLIKTNNQSPKQHGHLIKIRSSKEQAKHLGGAGQARWGAKHKEVHGKPLGGAGQAQEPVIKLNQKHHQPHHSHTSKPAQDQGITRSCIAMSKTLQASKFLHTQENNSNGNLSTKSFC